VESYTRLLADELFLDPILFVTVIVHMPHRYSSPSIASLLRPLLLVARRLADVQTQAVRVQIDLVSRLLQDLRNVASILKLPQVDICPALLDGISDELRRAGLTLRAHDGGLLLLARLVDDKGSALGFLLRDLLGLDCGGEFGGEGEVL